MNGPRFSWTNCYYFIKNPILFCMRIQLINYYVQNWNWNTIFGLKVETLSTKKKKREIDSVFYRIYICHFSCKTSCPILKIPLFSNFSYMFCLKKIRIWQNKETALKKSHNSCINFFGKFIKQIKPKHLEPFWSRKFRKRKRLTKSVVGSTCPCRKLCFFGCLLVLTSYVGQREYIRLAIKLVGDEAYILHGKEKLRNWHISIHHIWSTKREQIIFSPYICHLCLL